jgi:hypothetical protein
MFSIRAPVKMMALADCGVQRRARKEGDRARARVYKELRAISKDLDTLAKGLDTLAKDFDTMAKDIVFELPTDQYTWSDSDSDDIFYDLL